MRSFEITETKAFMSALLAGVAFDNFALSELKIMGSGYWTLEGKRNPAFYEESEFAELQEKEYLLWSEVKPIVFSMIKGNKTPLSMKITLKLNAANTEKTVLDCGTSIPVSQVGGIFLNIQYDRENLQVITGTSLKSFSMDRSLDTAWDEYAQKFLAKLGVI